MKTDVNTVHHRKVEIEMTIQGSAETTFGEIMKFRKKPVVIEAIHFNGDNHAACKEFCPSLQTESIDDDGAEYVLAHPRIPTLEGRMMVSVGDWIIKGVQGEFYPCKPDIFEATYELAQK